MQEADSETQTRRSRLDQAITEYYKKIGGNIHDFRVLQHMTQDRLAERCLLSTPYISQIERADLYKGITCQSIIQIAYALEVPACILMARKSCPLYLECVANIKDGKGTE